MSTVGWLIIGTWVAGWPLAAFLLYEQQAVREDMESPEYAAAFFGLAWPALFIGVAVFAPFWLMARAIKAARS